MNKSLLQKKFRFVMIIAALALFITIVTPAYIRYGKNEFGYPSVVMMWTVLFGTGGGNKLNNGFGFSFIAFFGYLMTVVLLIICLIRKFVTIEGTDEKKSQKGTVVLDTICMLCCLTSLALFIILPISLPRTDMWVEWAVGSFYGWGFSYILAYICLAVMFVSSLIVLYAETIVKIVNMKAKKAKAVETSEAAEVKEETKEVKKTKKAKDVKEEKVSEPKEEIKEEIVEDKKSDTVEAKEETVESKEEKE